MISENFRKRQKTHPKKIKPANKNPKKREKNNKKKMKWKKQFVTSKKLAKNLK